VSSGWNLFDVSDTVTSSFNIAPVVKTNTRSRPLYNRKATCDRNLDTGWFVTVTDGLAAGVDSSPLSISTCKLRGHKQHDMHANLNSCVSTAYIDDWRDSFHEGSVKLNQFEQLFLISLQKTMKGSAVEQTPQGHHTTWYPRLGYWTTMSKRFPSLTFATAETTPTRFTGRWGTTVNRARNKQSEPAESSTESSRVLGDKNLTQTPIVIQVTLQHRDGLNTVFCCKRKEGFLA
jgi:hypothetical protein